MLGIHFLMITTFFLNLTIIFEHIKMKLFKNLFGNKNENIVSKTKNQATYSIEEKLQFKVFPRIKNIHSQNLGTVYHRPLGGDLVLTFVQDINDAMTYVLSSEADQLKHLIDEWEQNISQIEFDIFTTEDWHEIVYFNEPGDYSNEKIFDINFVNTVCAQLKTDKVIFSISRRHRMQMISYYSTFKNHENFFLKHFDVWRDHELPDEIISEYILVGEQNRGIRYISDLGFRMNMYERNGEFLLSYSSFDDGANPLGDKIDFEEILEKRKVKFVYK